MNYQRPHIPGPPESPEPPSRLVEMADSFSHPAVTRVGLTTTAEGHWALMVRVQPGISIPIKEIEAVCSDNTAGRIQAASSVILP